MKVLLVKLPEPKKPTQKSVYMPPIGLWSIAANIKKWGMEEVYTTDLHLLSRGQEGTWKRNEWHGRDGPPSRPELTEKTCGYCGATLPGTLASCPRCGWQAGDRVEENREWYEENLRKARSKAGKQGGEIDKRGIHGPVAISGTQAVRR